MDGIKLGIMGLEEAKRLAQKAEAQGLTLKLEYNDHSCHRGCAITVEMWTTAEDYSSVLELLNEDFKTHARGEVDWSLVQSAVDLNAKETTCPACGCNFSPSLNECPDCGLCF